MKKTFTGTSTDGHLREALKNALEQAAAEFNKELDWELKETTGTQLALGPISVKIEVDTDKGGGPGPNDPR